MVACRIFSSPHDIVRRPRCCCCCCSLRRFSMRLSFRDRFVRISQPTPPHLPTPPLPVPPPFHFFFHSNCLSTIAFLSFRKKKREKKKRFSSFCPEIIKKNSNETERKNKNEEEEEKEEEKETIFIFSFDSRFSNAFLSFEK